MASKRDSKLKKIVEALKKEFKPSRMFLFGSRADGTHRSDSDYDFMLVVPRNRKSRIDNMVRAEEAVKKEVDACLDVFVYSQREFDDWKDELSSIPETAMNTGKEIDLG